MVAHALAQSGEKFVIVSQQKKRSPMGGAQYLHTYIPDLTDHDHEAVLRVIKLGTAEGYAAKMQRPVDQVSWHRYENNSRIPIWNLGEAYDRLWSMYHLRIAESTVTRYSLGSFLQTYDRVFSTIPRSQLCWNNHDFASQVVRIQTGEFGFHAYMMVYSGSDQQPWYRASNIFGGQSCEYPFSAEIPSGKARDISKPLSTDCDCWVDKNLEFVGRYGRWDRNSLTHDAYWQARGVLDAAHT